MLQLLDYLLEFPLATLAEISYHVHRPGKKPVRRRQNVDMKDYLEPVVLTIAVQRYGGHSCIYPLLLLYIITSCLKSLFCPVLLRHKTYYNLLLLLTGYVYTPVLFSSI